MYDEKELEELCDGLLGLDGDMFLESDGDMGELDNDLRAARIALSGGKVFSGFNNNNLLGDADGVLVDKPSVSIQLDLLNQNFISLNSGGFEGKSKGPSGVPDGRTAGGAVGRAAASDKKVDEFDNELKDVDEKLTSPISPREESSFHRVGGWAPDALGLWHSGPSSLNLSQPSHKSAPYQDLSSSATYISQGPQPFSDFSSSAKRTYSHQQLGAKVEMVYSLLSMLDTDNREDMSKTFLAMSSSAESCLAMRQSGCLPLLIQLIYSPELDKDVRNRAAEALQNVVYAQTDEKRRKREVRVLKLLQQLREYCDELKSSSTTAQRPDSDKHPINATGTLMKLSFDADHRHAICVLGGLHAITDLIQVDHEIHGGTNSDASCITLRRYAGMSLTNLTFGDGKNKALLCSFTKFLLALVDQLKSPSEDLRQVTASVLRNLSWRADIESKQALRNVNAVTALTVSAMEAKKESTLKSILSALWNLSAHCSLNKMDICSVPGALAFLVKMLKYNSASNTLSIIENAGGILRNISSHIAVREDYRQILRDNCCFEVFLEQLKSPSLTIVSNACGTLWNLSARCPEDQRRLWEMGATTMLRSLVQSKHKMISMGSSAALKNLLAANPNGNLLTHLDSTAKSLGLQNLPTLFVRKKRALEQELNITLAETCDNIEPVVPSLHLEKGEDRKEKRTTESPRRSESHDSVKSSQSDTVYELLNQRAHIAEDELLGNSAVTLHDSLDGKLANRAAEDPRLTKRCAASMIPTPTSKKINQDRINEKTREERLVAADAYATPTGADVREQPKPDPKQRSKKGIPVLKAKQKRPMLQEAQSSSTKPQEDFTFDYGETESPDRESAEDAVGTLHDTGGPGSHSRTNAITSSAGLIKHAKEDSDNAGPSDHILRTHKQRGAEDEKSGMRNSSVASGGSVESLPGGLGAVGCPERNSGEAPAPKGNPRDQSCGNTGNIRSGFEWGNGDPKNDELGLSGDSLEEAELFGQSPGCRTCQEPPMLPKEANTSAGISALGSGRSGVSGDEDAEGLSFFSRAAIGAHDPVKAANERACLVEGCEAEDAGRQKAAVQEEVSDRLSSASMTGLEGSGRAPTACVLPKFKVGSPITDSRILQMEARKLCREIQKDHEFDMGGSLLSEVSLVSCSSFLDTGDYSLFDSSSDAVNFDEAEISRPLPYTKHHHFPKSVSQATESGCSLPSLGSLRNEQIEALDLDNSVLSVASITSEIDENYAKDPAVSCCTKTYEVNAPRELPEEISGDATVVSRGDDTLNAELLDDDSSLHSQENLPLDPDTFQEQTAQRTRPRLTPREKRKTFHERYRTYTIRDFKAPSSTANAPAGDDQDKTDDDLTLDAEAGESPERVLGADGSEWSVNFSEESVCERAQGLPSATVGGGRGHEPIQFSKSFDGERDPIRGLPFDSKSLNDLLSIGPSERKELVDNAKLVAFSLKTAVQDWETEAPSDSEADEPHKYSDIDTATYTKNFRDQPHPRLSLEELEGSQGARDPRAEGAERVGAKVCKPGCRGEEEAEEPSKGVRGRRKPLYSSPHRHLARARESSWGAGGVKVVAATGEAKKASLEQAAACQSPVLNREGTFTKEDGCEMRKVGGKGVGTIPVLNRNLESKKTSRADGKNKLASSGSSKAAGESRISRIGRPLSTYASRADPAQRRPFSAGAGSRTAGESAVSPKKSPSAGLVTQRMKNSSSSQSVKSGSSPNSSGSVRSKSLLSESGKSQSDASLNSADSKDKVGKVRNGKKEVSSKIASLWRKVEETKERSKNVKDTRVWIEPEKGRAPSEALVLEKEEILHIPTRTIVHSFTCHALTDETAADATYPKRISKNSEDRTHNGGVEHRADKSQKRSVISAVVTPYNYNPPASVAAPSTFKEVDNFHKSSLKVTTV